jgi:hypothetical protein
MAVEPVDISFAANDWLYIRLLSRHTEVDEATHGAVVSDSQAVPAQLLGPGSKLKDAALAIGQLIQCGREGGQIRVALARL